jgi:RNA polymerase sigma-70 factor (ECF subfamily)
MKESSLCFACCVAASTVRADGVARIPRLATDRVIHSKRYVVQSLGERRRNHMAEQSDVELMERISMRHTDALKVLYERYGRVAFALAYRVIGEASAAEEVVQDAFETVWNKATTFDPAKGGNVRGWFLTIVHRRAIDIRRRELDRPPRRVPIDDMELNLSTPDAWGEVSATLLGDQVRKAMATLPPDQRRTIELAYFEGLSHGEIASQENAPVGTVKGRLRLGLRKLSGLLDHPDNESSRGKEV